MSWSKTAPIESGWYWQRSAYTTQEPVQIHGDGDVWWSERWQPADEIGGEWWSEPIKEPE